MPNIQQQSRAILNHHSRSFSWAATFLPPDRRDEAALLYAFCRRVDDAVDEAPDDEAAAENVRRINAELAGRAEPDELMGGFLQMADRRGVDLQAARELVAGVASDTGTVLLPDDRALIRYCYRVAGTVGLMMCPVIGVDDPRAVPFAIDLGIGMQLTNICRDVLEDADRGRVYLPQTRLKLMGTGQQSLLDGDVRPDRLAPIVRDLLDLADRYYASADRGMRYIPARSRLAILAASRIYRAIGVRLRRTHGANPLHGRTVVPAWQKTRWMAEATADFAALGARALGPEPQHDAGLHKHLDGLPGAHSS